MAVEMPTPRQYRPQATFRPPSRSQLRPSPLADDFFYSKPRSRSVTSSSLPLHRLPEDVGPHKLSRPPCSPTKRRRGASRNLSRSARQRHCARADCCIHTAARPLTSLDDLPWISALRIEPDPTNPWDIADLSCLNPTIEEEHASSGPVRRRKTSLRLDPLAQPKDEEMYCRDIPFPFIGRALFQDMTPQTPPPRDRFTPSNVFFHGLYPILPSEVEISSRSSEVETPL